LNLQIIPNAAAQRTAKPLKPLPEPGTYEFAVIDANDDRRQAVEAFIAARFYVAHNAQITSFMPKLLALFDQTGAIKAAIGVRAANHDDLFLEHYFDQSIEQVIGEKVNSGQSNIDRSQVVEVGNLASVDRFASRRLFEMLALFLIKNRFQWVVFTGCQSLRQIFKRMRLELLALGEAKESRLPESLGSWGSYYHDNPQVLVGHLSAGIGLAEAATAMTRGTV